MLWQNIALPVVLGLSSAAVFAGLVIYLLDTAHWVEHTDQVISQAHILHGIITEGETGMRGYMLTGEDRSIRTYENAETRWAEEYAAQSALISDNPVQISRMQRINATYSAWMDLNNEILKLMPEKKRLEPETALRLLSRRRQLMGEFRSQFAEFIGEEQSLRMIRAKEAATFSRMVLGGVIFISLLIAAIIALWGRRQLLSLSQTYEEALLKQAEQNEILQREQWFDQGRAALSERLISQASVPTLSQDLLTQIINLSGADVGMAFVVDRHSHAHFKRVAAVGVSAQEKQARYEFRLGEGLTGQTALERKARLIQDLPPDYFKLSSSLGETQAKSVMIIPATAGTELVAVFELGFLRTPEPRILEFLQQNTTNIASAILSAKYREQLEELLNEVQTQTEELQSQQEELRVSNEELEEQARLLREAQARAEAQNVDLEKSNAQLEEQKELLDRRNEELTRTRIDIERKASELARASHYKSEFLANMSHELRTPLNSALILSQLLSENRAGNLTDQQVEYAQQISRCGKDLLNLINDVLDISKVESGKMDLISEEFSIDSVLHSLRGMFEPLAHEKKLDLKITNEVGNLSLVSDRQRFEQILRNLVSNALKFTEQGSVHIKVGRAESTDRILFSVQDTGIGIQPENISLIFEAFRQADGTTSRKYGGTGLGLSISKELAQLLGGDIHVTSSPGEGSLFTLEIPLRHSESGKVPLAKIPKVEAAGIIPKASVPAPQSADRTPPVRQEDKKRSVLVIEDDPIFAKILISLVGELNFDVIHADTAEKGLEIASQENPYAVILDMKLPDHSGLFVLDHLKNDSRTRHIPVHVISVEDFSNYAFQMGAIGYLLKPVKREQIQQALTTITEKSSAQVQRVLVVEDDEGQRMAIRGLIEGDRIQISAVGTGEEALQKLENEKFDCIVLDLSLPDMSGLNLLEKMAADEERRHPPVIIYTGRDLSPQEENQLKRYSQSIIIKGAKSPERLLDEVTLFLHQVEAHLPDRLQRVLSEFRNREKFLAGVQILLVDDDMRNVFALSAVLEQRGAVPIVARNGQEALDIAQSDRSIDLILMDVMMPVMDGYQATRLIRQIPSRKKTPIIALTAKAMKDDRARSLDSGASDYLPKPVQVDKLLSLIRVWLASQRGSRS